MADPMPTELPPALVAQVRAAAVDPAAPAAV